MGLKKIFWLIIILAIIGAGVYFGYSIYQDKKAWKVEITTEYINVRDDHNVSKSEKIGKVYNGEKYKVLEIYLDDSKYVWYKIKVNKDLTGWISSGRSFPYVNEINNPNVKDEEVEENYEIDYQSPVVKFEDNVYLVYDINSINYDHLKIEEKNKYTIEHKVYYEEKPEDSDIPQYWIQYIVKDEAGNTTKKVQKIEFDVDPDPSEVLDFKDLVR